MPSSRLVAESSPSTVISPPQLSTAVNHIDGGTSPVQETVMSTGAAGKAGAIVSFTFMVCDTDEVLPQASVNVQVLVTINELVQDPE